MDKTISEIIIVKTRNPNDETVFSKPRGFVSNDLQFFLGSVSHFSSNCSNSPVSISFCKLEVKMFEKDGKGNVIFAITDS